MWSRFWLKMGASEEPAPRYPPSKERSLTDLLRREYELATSARPIHPPDTAASLSAVESVELAGREQRRGQQRSVVEASAPQAKGYSLCALSP